MGMRDVLGRIAGYALISVASLLVTGAAAMAQERGGTMVQVQFPEPPGIVPYLNTSLAVPQVSAKIYEGLLEYGLDTSPLPNLARSWEVSEDGKSITFRLQEGVKFHDGVAFTSADVKFSIMEVLKKYHPRGIIFLSAIDDVETPDELTAIFKLSEPAPYLLRAMSGADTPILPKHIFENGDIRNHPNANQPVGTGPFMFGEWRRGEFVRLDRNPAYWREGKPYLDRIVIQFVPDASTRAALIEKGDAHITGFGSLSYNDARRLADQKVVEMTTEGYNMFSLVEGIVINTARAPFNNQKVRQAISYAVDRQFIIDNVYAGFAKPATGFISSDFKANGIYTDDVRNYSVPDAIEIANRLLDEAGYPRKADGIRFEATLDTTASYGESNLRAAEVVQQNFAKVGIRLNLRNEDLPTFLKRVFTDYDYDIHQTGLANLADPVLGAHRAVHSNAIKKGSVFMNNSQWFSAETDRLMDAAKSEVDPEKRKALYHEIQKLVTEAAPNIWIAELNWPTLMSKKLRDAITTAQGLQGSFHSAWLEK